MCKGILVAGLVAIATYPALGQSHDPSTGSGQYRSDRHYGARWSPSAASRRRATDDARG
jgi:hypothetical protein